MATTLTLHVDARGETLSAARRCESAVFLETYGNSAEQWDDEYGPYDATSRFIVITEPGGDAVACLRLVVPGPIGFKTLADVGRLPWQVDGERSALAAGVVLGQTWDVATLALRRGAFAHRAQVAAALYHGLFHAARVNDIRFIVMILDSRVRRLLNALSIDTELLPATFPAPYLGSESSVPLWGDLPRMADWQRRANPDAHRLVNQGVGLGDIELPRNDGWMVSDRPPKFEPCSERAYGSVLDG